MLLYCAATAYTWKTAFDAGYAKYSPGALLVDKIVDELFTTGGIDAFESCSPEGGFMNQIWDGRRTTIDLLANVGTKESLNFIMAALGERGYAQLRGLRNRLRAASWSAIRTAPATGRPISDEYASRCSNKSAGSFFSSGIISLPWRRALSPVMLGIPRKTP